MKNRSEIEELWDQIDQQISTGVEVNRDVILNRIIPKSRTIIYKLLIPFFLPIVLYAGLTTVFLMRIDLNLTTNAGIILLFFIVFGFVEVFFNLKRVMLLRKISYSLPILDVEELKLAIFKVPVWAKRINTIGWILLLLFLVYNSIFKIGFWEAFRQDLFLITLVFVLGGFLLNILKLKYLRRQITKLENELKDLYR